MQGAPSGERRDVSFTLGALNVLTGKSKTGKSAILDIVEYCLGRDTVTIPTGVISDHADWYYVLVQIGDVRIFVARPNPETASTNRAMIRTGDVRLSVPSHAELEINSDTTVVRDVLSTRLGIERFVIEADSRSLRNSFEVTVRQALFFCFQKQGEIGNQVFLFHRQAEDGVKPAIRDTLPYFLGASTPEQAAIERELTQARRMLLRYQRDIRIIEADFAQQGSRLENLVRTATSLRILPETTDRLDGSSIRRALEAIIAFSLPDDADSEEGANEVLLQRRQLLELNRSLRARLRDVEDQLTVIGSLDGEQSA